MVLYSPNRQFDLHLSPTKEVLRIEQTEHMFLENPSVIQSEGNVDANLPSCAHEETTHQVKIEAPTVHPDGQTSNSEAQAIGEQLGNTCPNTPSSFNLQKPATYVASPDWLPNGWTTVVRFRKTGRRVKFYYSPLLPSHPFRSKNEVLNFLEKGQLDKRKCRPKMKPGGEFGVETKGLSGTTSEIYSSASNVGKISPYGAPLPFSHSPMFGFTPQLEAVNKLSIPTATPISHLHFSAESQSAINPDIIRRPTNVRWALNGPEGSYVPIFTEEKPIES